MQRGVSCIYPVLQKILNPLELSQHLDLTLLDQSRYNPDITQIFEPYLLPIQITCKFLAQVDFWEGGFFCRNGQ